MKRFLVLTLAIVIIFAVIIGGCAAPAASPDKTTPATQTPAQGKTAPKQNMVISFGSTHPGTSSYVIGVAVCRMIEKYNPYIKATNETVGGGSAILKLVLNKGAEIGFASAIDMYDAPRGTGLFKDGPPIPVRAMWTGHKLLYQLITIKPTIRALKDLKGATIAWREISGGPHMAMVATTTDYLVENFGFSKTDINTVDRRETNASVQGLLDGSLDVFSTLATGGAAITELAIKKPESFTVLPYDGPALDYVQKKWPAFAKDVVPKGLYQKLPANDVPVPSTYTYEWADASLSDDLVYDMVKAVFDNIAEFQQLAGPTGPEYTLQNAVKYPVIPFHPGAIKYYKEKGVWNADLDKRQQQLLTEVKK